MTPTCWIIAGPNGAGKTTFALEYLPRVVGCTHYHQCRPDRRRALTACTGAGVAGRQPDLSAGDRRAYRGS